MSQWGRRTDGRAWPRAVAATVVVVYALGAALSLRLNLLVRDVADVDGVFLEQAAFMVAFAAFVVVGALIVANRPQHPIGWIFVTIGLTLGVLPIGNDLAGYLIATGREPSTVVLLFAWVNNWYWYALLYLLLVLVPLLFPTGRPPTRRWRWVAVVGGFATAAIVIVGALAEIVDGQNTEWNRPSPVGIDGLGFVEEIPAMGPAFLLFAAATVAALVSFVVRFRRSGGEERQQLKWFILAVTFLPLIMVPDALVEDIAILEALLFPTAVAMLPVAAGIAVLRYRLYDIDVVISRSLVFAVLAAFITGVYVAIVVGLGDVLGAGTGRPSLTLSIAATAVVAIAFEPVRARAQRWANRLVFGRRASPYEVLSRLTSQLDEAASDEDLLDRLKRLLADGTGADATVWLRIGDEYRPAASSGGAPRSPVVAPEGVVPRVEGADLTVPVAHDGASLGLLTLTAPRGQQVSPADERLVRDVAGNAGLLLRNVRLNAELADRAEDLRASRHRLVTVQDQTRRELERDLHDGAQQHVIAVAMQLNVARTVAAQEGLDDVAEELGTLIELDQQAADQLRTVARGIYPPLLESSGLAAAIGGAASSLPIDVRIAGGDLARFDPRIEASAYFCVLEALRDAIRRDASGAAVAFGRGGDTLELEIGDDGAPGPTERAATRLLDRVHAHDGRLDTTRTAGRTRVVIALPATAGVTA